MPLIFLAGCVWVLGTALGLALSFGAGLALLCALAWSANRMALALLLCAAFSLGLELRERDARCLSAAREATSWELRLLADAAPGAFAMATMHEGGCRIRVALAVRAGSAPAGSLVRVTGAEPVLGERGLMLRDGRVVQVRGPSLLSRWRNHVAAGIDRRFGDDAGLARALLIADTHGLSPELRERYTDAGLVHILSISGLHVGIIGGALLLAVEALRLPALGGRVAAMALVLCYVLAIGAPAAAMRSAALFAAVTMTRLLQRPTHPWAPFAIAALVPLLEPRTVLDLGWQLSVSGYAGVLAAGRAARRVLPERWRGWRAHISRELIAGVLTTLATAPLVAWHFGRLSLVGVVSNLAAGPVVAILQPTLFVAMLAPGDALGRFVADAAGPMMRALDAVASVSASLPGATLAVAPTLVAAGLAGIGVVALLAASWSRDWPRWALLALTVTALLAWVPAPRLIHDGRFEVHMLDVGQGDAVALRTPLGRWILVDAGRAWSSGDAGRSTVLPYLRRRGGALALFVLTHPHADHVGGAASVIRALRPAAVRDAAFVAGSEPYAEMLAATHSVQADWARVQPGERMEIDGLELEFLAPDSAWTVALDDPNEASTVLRVQYGERSLLLTGDAEVGLESWLLEHAADRLDVDLLKVGHHGSSTSSTQEFIDAVSPRVALVSVGVANSYGHPSPEVMLRLVDAGATVLRTDQLGSLVLRSDGRTWEAQAAGRRWSVRLPEAPLP
jgi:competence protein ComEC